MTFEIKLLMLNYILKPQFLLAISKSSIISLAILKAQASYLTLLVKKLKVVDTWKIPYVNDEIT